MADKNVPTRLKQATMLDNIWLISFPLLKPLNTVKCYNWSGYMQSSVKGDVFHVSDIQILPFINLDPKNDETLFSALDFAQTQMSKLYPSVSGQKKKQAAVTLDQQFHEKVDDIWCDNRQRFDQIFPRLGGFHMLMSYMGAVGFLMKGSVCL